MSITHIKGNLFDTDIFILAHGCNTSGVMGAGIATTFKDCWPAMYEGYRASCLQGKAHPGEFYLWFSTEGKQGLAVFNLYTQDLPGRHARLEWIEQAFRSMALTIKTRSLGNQVAIPRIGAGIGGLKWADVEAAIERGIAEYPALEVVVYTL